MLFDLPCYVLDTHVGDILKHIISTGHNVKNSRTLKSRLDGLIFGVVDILVSFDGLSLFTSIEILLAIKDIMDKWDTITRHTTVPK